MKIAYIIPGSGGSFYCENCMRDSTVTGALVKNGFTVVQIPMYLPLFRDGASEPGTAPIFYGAVSLYLRERFKIFRRLPASFDKLLNSKPVLALASRMAGSTRARGLEEMTLSMLGGEEGREAGELERLVKWLKTEIKPDLIHLSNALLLGLAGRLKEELGVPIVCSLQDEHTWIDPMAEDIRTRAWELLQEKARVVDRFIAVSAFYQSEMSAKLKLAPGRSVVIPLGVDTSRYICRAEPPSRPVIGFLSRIEETSGLDRLIEAVQILAVRFGMSDVKLVAYGGMTADDVPYVRRMKKLIHAYKLEGRVSIITAYDRNRRFEFLSMLSLLSVPRTIPEAFGMFLLEALASGVPVVEPDIGAFPEIISSTGGGLLYPEGNTELLAEALRRLLTDRALAASCARQGCTRVRELYALEIVAEKIGALYRSLAG
jgi:glycosyltransferase involved in cell wall biosynthesis